MFASHSYTAVPSNSDNNLSCFCYTIKYDLNMDSNCMNSSALFHESLQTLSKALPRNRGQEPGQSAGTPSDVLNWPVICPQSALPASAGVPSWPGKRICTSDDAEGVFHRE